MRIAALIICLLFSTVAFAAKNPGCDLSAAGIKDKKELHKFFAKLKDAAASGDRATISKMANYPLRVGKSRIKNETTLKRKFTQIFTPKVLKAIANLKQDDLFCNYQGVMIGAGEVWIQEVEGVIVISSIYN